MTEAFDPQLATLGVDLTKRGVLGSYVVTLADGGTGLGCGECDWEHALPTPFMIFDAARLSSQHWREHHAGVTAEG